MATYSNSLVSLTDVGWVFNNTALVSNTFEMQAGGTADIDIPDLQDVYSNSAWFTMSISPDTDRYTFDTYVQITLQFATYNEYLKINACQFNMPLEIPLRSTTELLNAIHINITTLNDVVISDLQFCMEIAAQNAQMEREIPKYLYVRNPLPISIPAFTKTQVAVIPATILTNTDAGCRLVLQINATTDTLCYVHFFDNTVEELFSPVITQLQSGYNEVTIPSAVTELVAGVHLLSVSVWVDNPVTLQPCDAFYIIESGFLAQKNPAAYTYTVLGNAIFIHSLTTAAERCILVTDDKDMFWIITVDSNGDVTNTVPYKVGNTQVTAETIDACFSAFELPYLVPKGVHYDISESPIYWFSNGGNYFVTYILEDGTLQTNLPGDYSSYTFSECYSLSTYNNILSRDVYATSTSSVVLPAEYLHVLFAISGNNLYVFKYGYTDPADSSSGFVLKNTEIIDCGEPIKNLHACKLPFRGVGAIVYKQTSQKYAIYADSDVPPHIDVMENLYNLWS